MGREMQSGTYSKSPYLLPDHHLPLVLVAATSLPTVLSHVHPLLCHMQNMMLVLGWVSPSPDCTTSGPCRSLTPTLHRQRVTVWCVSVSV